MYIYIYAIWWNMSCFDSAHEVKNDMGDMVPKPYHLHGPEGCQIQWPMHGLRSYDQTYLYLQ